MKKYEKEWPARIDVMLNGRPLTAMLDEPGLMAGVFLRTALASRDVPAACGLGDCGACMILIDGEPALACITPAARLDGAEVETRRGVQESEEGARVADAILRTIARDACGYCLAGNIVLGTWLWRSGAGRETVEAVFATQDCACSGRQPYIDAVLGVLGKRDPTASDGDPTAQGKGADTS